MDKRIAKISIYELFGMFNHEIPLHTSDNITILHGQNGVGKTTVLKIIDDLFNARLITLFKYTFKSLKIDFMDGDCLFVEKVNHLEEKENRRKIVFCGLGISEPVYLSDIENPINHRMQINLFEEFLPFLERIGPRKWFDRKFGDRLTEYEVHERYQNELPQFSMFQSHLKEQKDNFEIISAALKCVTTHFIQTQRLFVENRSSSLGAYKSKITIEKNAVDMAERIKDTIRNSGVRSASLDRTFPNRILSEPHPCFVDDEFIRRKYSQQNDYRLRLMNAGLIDEEEGGNLLPEDELDEQELRVLWHYLNDIDEKFAVFSTILPQIELFMDIINSRFRYKKMNISKKDGFNFISANGQPIPLKALSSGEQHELVLTYGLIFEVPQKTLILIDEPELSLHVTWQQKFLSDLKRISQLAKLDFIIATHSPSIVHEHRNLMEEIPTELMEVYNV